VPGQDDFFLLFTTLTKFFSTVPRREEGGRAWFFALDDVCSPCGPPARVGDVHILFFCRRLRFVTDGRGSFPNRQSVIL